MKSYILAILFVLITVAAAFAAKGDKAPTFTPAAGTPANSTATSKAAGELKYDASYVYLNVSSAARPHWRRVSLGASF